LENRLAEPRKRYEDLIAHPQKVQAILQEGAEKARQKAKPMLANIRQAIGI
jgi:tryptophanyl-tRNA synthetase